MKWYSRRTFRGICGLFLAFTIFSGCAGSGPSSIFKSYEPFDLRKQGWPGKNEILVHYIIPVDQQAESDAWRNYSEAILQQILSGTVPCYALDIKAYSKPNKIETVSQLTQILKDNVSDFSRIICSDRQDCADSLFNRAYSSFLWSYYYRNLKTGKIRHSREIGINESYSPVVLFSADLKDFNSGTIIRGSDFRKTLASMNYYHIATDLKKGNSRLRLNTLKYEPQFQSEIKKINQILLNGSNYSLDSLFRNYSDRF